MAPPFSARRPSPDLLLERRRGNIPPCGSSHWGLPRLLQLRGGIFERVRICTSHRATSWVLTSLACSGSSLSLEASTLARPVRGHLWALPPAVGCLFRHRSYHRSPPCSVIMRHHPPIKRLLLVPPPASSGEERHMADSRLSSRPLAFNLIAQCLFCFPSAFGAERRH